MWQFIHKYSEQFSPLNVLFQSNNTETILKAVSSRLGFAVSFSWIRSKNKHLPSYTKKFLKIIELDV